MRGEKKAEDEREESGNWGPETFMAVRKEEFYRVNT